MGISSDNCFILWERLQGPQIGCCECTLKSLKSAGRIFVIISYLRPSVSFGKFSVVLLCILQSLPVSLYPFSQNGTINYQSKCNGLIFGPGNLADIVIVRSCWGVILCPWTGNFSPHFFSAWILKYLIFWKWTVGVSICGNDVISIVTKFSSPFNEELLAISDRDENR